MFIFSMQVVNAGDLDKEKLHTTLITTAIHFDVFNQKCRGVSLAKKIAKVNRLFLSKYDFTVNNYIETYLSQDPRVAKSQLRKQMLNKIIETGGCKQLRQKRAGKKFKKDYRKYFKQVEQSSWIPKVTRTR
jgi:hypothetical protein